MSKTVDHSIAYNPLDMTAVQRLNHPKSSTEVQQVAKKFEAIMIQLMLQAMRKTIPDNGFFNSEHSKMWEGIYDQALADQLSHQIDFGLSKQMMQRYEDEISIPTHEDFLNRIRIPAQKAGDILNIPSTYVMAQAILESGWGAKELRTPKKQSAHNLLNIKAGSNWMGPVTEIRTSEFKHGKIYHTHDKFRVYASDLECFMDYARMIHKKTTMKTDMKDGFLEKLSYYATDPLYKKKVSQMIVQLEQQGQDQVS